MNNVFYDYVLLDTTRPGHYDFGKGLIFKFEPFYVGKGKGKRCNAHFMPSSLKADSAKNRRIKRILKQTGEFPKVSIKKRDVEEWKAFECEYKLIQIIGRKDRKEGPLLNQNAGGAGSSGRIVSVESREKASITVKKTLSETSEKVLKKRHANISKAHASKSDEEREAFRSKCQDSNRSGDAAVRKKMSKSGKQRVKNMTAHEKRRQSKTLSKAVTRMWDGLDQEQRSARIRKAHLSRDNEAISKKISSSVANVHASRTPEQKAEIAEKIRQTLLRRNAEKRAAQGI